MCSDYLNTRMSSRGSEASLGERIYRSLRRRNKSKKTDVLQPDKERATHMVRNILVRHNMVTNSLLEGMLWEKTDQISPRLGKSKLIQYFLKL